VGFSDGSANISQNVLVQTNDVMGGFSGLTKGVAYYLSQSVPGGIASTRPSSGIIIRVGIAKSATELDIHILDYTLIKAEMFAAGALAQSEEIEPKVQVGGETPPTISAINRMVMWERLDGDVWMIYKKSNGDLFAWGGGIIT